MTRGDKLRAAMKEAGMTEFQLARKMWVSPAYVIALMKDKTEMDGPTMRTIERILGLERGALELSDLMQPDDYDEKKHSGLIEE